MHVLLLSDLPVCLAYIFTVAVQHLVIVINIIITSSSTDHGNKSLFDLIINKVV